MLDYRSTGLSKEDLDKYRRFISKRLDKEDGLAVILLYLTKNGLDKEVGKSLIREIALKHSKKMMHQSAASMIIAIGGILVVILLLMFYKGNMHLNVTFVGTLGVGGLISYFRARKRVRYLKSLSKDKE